MNGLDGALISAAGALLFGAVGLVLWVEAYLLASGRKPITTYTRNAIESWPGPAFSAAAVLVFGVGALFAHFFWDAGGG